MYKDEFQKLNPTEYIWAIFDKSEVIEDRSHPSYDKEARRAYWKNPKLDLTGNGATDTFRDGLYDMYHKHADGWMHVTVKAEEGEAAEIKDGKFVPEPTMRAFKRVMMSDKHHVYLETIKWSNVRNAFVVTTGS